MLEEAHLWTAGRYVEMNPVRARLVAHPADWPWSSARANLELDAAAPLGDPRPLIERFGDWSDYLAAALTMGELEKFRRHIRTGRPLGHADFLARLETLLSRPLLKRKPGPKPKTAQRQVPGQELWEN